MVNVKEALASSENQRRELEGNLHVYWSTPNPPQHRRPLGVEGQSKFTELTEHPEVEALLSRSSPVVTPPENAASLCVTAHCWKPAQETSSGGSGIRLTGPWVLAQTPTSSVSWGSTLQPRRAWVFSTKRRSDSANLKHLF